MFKNSLKYRSNFFWVWFVRNLKKKFNRINFHHVYLIWKSLTVCIKNKLRTLLKNTFTTVTDTKPNKSVINDERIRRICFFIQWFFFCMNDLFLLSCAKTKENTILRVENHNYYQLSLCFFVFSIFHHISVLNALITSLYDPLGTRFRNESHFEWMLS